VSLLFAHPAKNTTVIKITSRMAATPNESATSTFVTRNADGTLFTGDLTGEKPKRCKMITTFGIILA
jgi:hypothetical protein